MSFNVAGSRIFWKRKYFGENSEKKDWKYILLNIQCRNCKKCYYLVQVFFFSVLFAEYSEKILKIFPLSRLCQAMLIFTYFNQYVNQYVCMCANKNVRIFSKTSSEHSSKIECIKIRTMVSTYRKGSESQNREKSEKRPIENLWKFSHRKSIGKNECTCQSCSVVVSSYYLLLP